MEKFTQHTGVGVPLRRSNVDTDQIIPAVYLKRVTRTGFEDALFAAWRGDPELVLNQPAYSAGSVLVAGPTEVDSPGWSGPQEAVLRRYFVPVPGMDRVAALSFLTPNLDLAEDFAELFDSVAATLRFR